MHSQLKKRAKERYKYPVRRFKKDLLKCRKMAEVLVGDSSRDFWWEVLHCKTNKQMSAMFLDGVHGDASIANLWASKFKDLLSMPDPGAHSQLDDTPSKLKITRGESHLILGH